MRARSLKIDSPASYFALWHYRIDAHHYETLGVTLRTFIKNKTSYKSYARQIPPDFAFAQGYVFYQHDDPTHYLQVAADIDNLRIEIHEGHAPPSKPDTHGYIVTTQDLADWLRTGQRPDCAKVVDLSASKAGLLAWQLVKESTP